MTTSVQNQLALQSSLAFAFQDGATDPKINSPPYGNSAAEFLEAQAFGFSANYLGGVWSNMNQFSEYVVSDQDVNGLQMIDFPNLTGLPQDEGLFNSDYLP